MPHLSKPIPLNPELADLLEWARQQPPMTPAQLREQRISFAYGNCALDNPRITREMVEQEHDRMYGVPENGSEGR